MDEEEPKLTPARPEDVAQTLAFALRFKGQKRFQQAENLMAQIAAAHLVAHLDASGFVVMKKPTASAPNAPAPYASEPPKK